ncbi:MAG: hypothetical protein AABZ74_14700 [Cyanobacteriota bacterium]
MAFVTVFVYNSSSWAAAEKAEKVAQVVQLQQEKFALASDEAPFQIAARKSMGMDNNMIWIASIFVAGLGQILMGDLWRGLKFTLIVYGTFIVGGIVTAILTGILATVSVGLAFLGPIIGLVVYIIGLIFYVLNIMDAYSMSQETSGMSSIDSAKFAEELQKLNDTFKVGNNKAEMTVFAF